MESNIMYDISTQFIWYNKIIILLVSTNSQVKHGKLCFKHPHYFLVPVTCLVAVIANHKIESIAWQRLSQFAGKIQIASFAPQKELIVSFLSSIQHLKFKWQSSNKHAEAFGHNCWDPSWASCSLNINANNNTRFIIYFPRSLNCLWMSENTVELNLVTSH